MDFRVFFVLALSGALSFFVAFCVMRYAELLRLVQIPNNRSSHEKPTPSGGGIGIAVSVTLAGGILISDLSTPLREILWLAIWLAVIGLLDDIHFLSIKIRVGMQMLVVAGLLMLLGDLPPVILFENMALQGLFLSILLLLTGVWWINLFNFMDGVDGIAGAQAVTMLLPAAALAAWTNADAMANPVWILILCMGVATMGFLLLNWPTARIFMGDVGSNWLAFSIFAVALLTIQAGWLSYPAWLVLAAVFVTDATVTLLARMVRGDRWYEAHRSHAYQRLSRRWRGDRKTGHRTVTLLTVAVNVLWLSPLAWACLRFPQWELAWLALAYAPLILLTVSLGAGRPDDEGGRTTA